MKSFAFIAAVACLAVVVLQFAQIDAQQSRRCRQRPPLNSTDDVECDVRQRPLGSLLCRRVCRLCYEREELARPPSCLVKGRCVCLGKGEGSTTTTTTEVTTTSEVPTTTEVTTTSEVPTTTEVTTVSQEPTTTQGSGSTEPTTTEGPGETSTAGPEIPTSTPEAEVTTTEAPAAP